MKKLILIGLLVLMIGFVLPSCSDSTSSDSNETRYWINSDTNVRHNSSCRWYGNTNEGYYTYEEVGTACGICGG